VGGRGGGLCIKRVPRPPTKQKRALHGLFFPSFTPWPLSSPSHRGLGRFGFLDRHFHGRNFECIGLDPRVPCAMAAAATWLINSSTSTFGLWAKDSGNVCSANICSSLFVIVSFSPNRKLATPHRKRAYVRPRLKTATAATLVPEAQRHSGEADQPRSRPRRARRRESPPRSSGTWEERFLFFMGSSSGGGCCFFNARRVVAGVELVQKIVKGQFDVPTSFGTDPFCIWYNMLAA
jgi:hypothetical protein